jgi:hypothetical protein
MRSIRQPGAPLAPRAIAVPCRATPVDVELAPGRPLLDALHDLVAAHGAEGAALFLEGGWLDPFGYVMPALSPDATHAAWYSAPRHPAGGAAWDAGCVTVGWRDGQKFFHCHGLWTEADGGRSGGHVLPEATSIAAPIRVRGAVVAGARFEAADDPETGFRLFGPVATTPHPTPNARAVRLRPNQDITAALAGAAAGLAAPRLAGAVGSIIGARFTDAPAVEPFATELFLRPGPLAAPLRGGLVDYTGALAEGTLVPGDNPVLMTVEAVLLAA